MTTVVKVTNRDPSETYDQGSTGLQIGASPSPMRLNWNHVWWNPNLQNSSRDTDWKEKIARRQNASHYFSREKHTGDNLKRVLYAVGRSVNAPKNYYSESRVWRSSAQVPSVPAGLSWVDDVALKKIKSKLGAAQNQFRALVPLAELRETAGLYRSCVKSTNDMLKALIRIKHGKVRGAFSAASKVWLNYSFAVSPTINDIGNLCEAIGQHASREDFVGRYSGTHETRGYVTRGNSDSTTIGSIWLVETTPGRMSYTYRVKYTAGVNFTMRSANNYGPLADFNRDFGLNMGQLIPTAWELVPFSWVVDYFTTTGALLEDVFSSDAVNTIYLTRSNIFSYEFKEHFKATQQTSPVKPVISLPKSWTDSYSGVSIVRTPLTNLPSRQLRVKTMDEIGANGVKRVLNLASVLMGAAKPSSGRGRRD